MVCGQQYSAKEDKETTAASFSTERTWMGNHFLCVVFFRYTRSELLTKGSLRLLVWFLNKDFEWNLIFVLRPRGQVGVVALFVLHRKDLYYMHFVCE